ncbi:polysaccharide deacetylase [Pseudodesulfovibrio mercurii]|uniref:Polysaccharide deacetylase n=1 Tax=Pseudodesulfovibrio mercurii TaxID=641491 RepID=F0JC61_9BACT|nr:polysaccharide deacetylase family protein [Pseudodesulfovibrio mercurii]EGB15634.1 polysaccharide deacetylase [Pseudodesulfovibrio mercurii]
MSTPAERATAGPLAVLTFDTDWAPRFMVDRCLDILDRAGAKATFFCTGPYDFRGSGRIETALHPNFLPGSTQGADPEAVVSGLKALYPDAVGTRSHRYFWHVGLRPVLLRHGLRYDCSQIMPGQAHLGLAEHLGLKRGATWWSDNLHLHHGLDPAVFDPPGLTEPGLKILDIHPVHVCLNTPDPAWFRATMAGLPPLPELTEEDVAPLRHPGPGVGTWLERAVASIPEIQDGFVTLREVLGI